MRRRENVHTWRGREILARSSDFLICEMKLHMDFYFCLPLYGQFLPQLVCSFRTIPPAAIYNHGLPSCSYDMSYVMTYGGLNYELLLHPVKAWKEKSGEEIIFLHESFDIFWPAAYLPKSLSLEWQTILRRGWPNMCTNQENITSTNQKVNKSGEFKMAHQAKAKRFSLFTHGVSCNAYFVYLALTLAL